MALRMAVNDEQGELDRLLQTGPELLGGSSPYVLMPYSLRAPGRQPHRPAAPAPLRRWSYAPGTIA